MQDGGQAGEGEAHPGEREAADDHLALAADVEQPALHGQGHGQAGEDERRGPVEHVAPAVAVFERGFEYLVIDVQGVFPAEALFLDHPAVVGKGLLPMALATAAIKASFWV